MHHFVAHVDRRAEQLQRPFDDVDGTIDPGTESTRIGEQQAHVAHRLTAGAEPERLLSRIASRISSPAPIVIADVRHVEGGKLPSLPVKVDEIDHMAEPHAVDHVAERAAQDQREPCREERLTPRIQ